MQENNNKLLNIIERRNQVQRRIAKALEHYPGDAAQHIIMAWISIDDLEAMAKTICKDDE